MSSTNMFALLSSSQSTTSNSPSTPTQNTSSSYNPGTASTVSKADLSGFSTVSYVKKKSSSPSPKPKTAVVYEIPHVNERTLVLKKREPKKGKKGKKST